MKNINEKKRETKKTQIKKINGKTNKQTRRTTTKTQRKHMNTKQTKNNNNRQKHARTT